MQPLKKLPSLVLTIYMITLQNRSISYKDFIQRCNLLNIEVDEVELSKMFILDYLIANDDRHLNNFGFIRDSDTIEWMGLSPIFDSGSAMFHNKCNFELENILNSGNDELHSKPFYENPIEQLKIFPLEKCLCTINFENLDGIDLFYKKLLHKNKRYISTKTISLLSRILLQRVFTIKQIRENYL